MNLRHPKVVRLGGWGALLLTVLAAGAGAFLANSSLQDGDLLNGGIAAGMTVVVALCGGLLSYCLFAFAKSQAGTSVAATDVATTREVPQAPVEETPSDETSQPEELSVSITANPADLPSAPETSDDAIPVFAAATGFDVDATDSDDFDEDLLVVPPPVADAEVNPPTLDVAETTTNIWDDEFDSSMDLPVTVDPVSETSAESNDPSDDVDAAAPVVQAQTDPVACALTQTAEVEAVLDLPDDLPPPVAEPTPAPVVAKAPHPAVQAFPEIFKTAPAPAPTPAPVAKAAPAPIPAPAPPAAKPAQAPAAKAPPAVVASAAPRVEPPAEEPKIDDLLPTAAELPDMATTLTPTKLTGGALPTEIPDFFLRMPTGRTGQAPRPAMPIAPVTPRQVAPPKPAPPVAPAAVRIVDSSTIESLEEDLVTMTAIPDDWPS